jgi:glutathione S-transferase
MFELLTTESCRWSVRNLAVLIEKRAEFRLVDVAEGAGGRKAAWYATLTPFGKTPALRHGDRVVVESLLINEYLEETAPGRALLPRDPFERAWARTWNAFCDQDLMRHVRSAVTGAPAERQRALGELESSLTILETHAFRHASPGEFWGGDEPALTDFCYWSLFDVLERVETDVPVSELLERRPRIRRWAQHVLSHPTLVEAVRCLDATRWGAPPPADRARET